MTLIVGVYNIENEIKTKIETDWKTNNLLHCIELTIIKLMREKR